MAAKRRRLPNGEEPRVDREARWSVWLAVAVAAVAGLLFGSLVAAGLAMAATLIGIEVATRVWEDVEGLRGNDPYADRRAESEFLHEERLRHERNRQRRRAARRARLLGLLRSLGRRRK